ncbi:MAG TPA: hypothetical protein VHY35_10545 [Stellaceae bacterium]|nr:hypothetical protein [Stellaceae bacterium]
MRDEETGRQILRLAERIGSVRDDHPDHDLLVGILAWDQNPDPAEWRRLLDDFERVQYRGRLEAERRAIPRTDAKIAALAAAIDANPSLVDDAYTPLVGLVMVWRDLARAAPLSIAARAALQRWLDLKNELRWFIERDMKFGDYFGDDQPADWHNLDSNEERDRCVKELARFVFHKKQQHNIT